MDAAADPLLAARPEEVPERERAGAGAVAVAAVGAVAGETKAGESQDDGYETSNSGEPRRKPSSGGGSPGAEPAAASPGSPHLLPPPPPEFDVMRHAAHYAHYPAPPDEQPYQHFPFPKYSDPYAFKREPDAPYDMSQHHHHHQQHHQHHQYGMGQPGNPQHKRDEDMYNGIKRECEDPYSFVEEEAMSLMLGQHHHPHALPHDPGMHHEHHHQMALQQPKKRGRKKKIKDENGMEIKAEGMEGVPRPVKERKKHDRFNGMSEEEVSRRTLPDHLAENLDIIIIGINPGLFAAYKGHHYAGPGNHFWKCLYLSGLTREQMSADEDYKLLNFGIGFTNMVSRATKGSADLTRREIKEGSALLLDKLQTFRPKVAVFNGKLIYEVFSGKKDFCFGKQPDPIAGTNTYMWVMPSSSARCAQLPRAADKVPFYAALKKFRDFLNGAVPHVDEAELVFPDTTGRRPQDDMEIRRLTMEPEPGDTIILEDGTEVPLKKKRGRPKKVKLENGEVAPPTPRAPRAPRAPPALDASDPPKKKRGRPKKIRPEEQAFLLQQQQQQQQQQAGMLGAPLPSMQPHDQQYMAQYTAPPGGGGGGGGGAQLPSPLAQQPMYLPQQTDNQNYFQTPNAEGGVGALGGEGPLELALGVSRGYGSPGAYAASPRPVYHSPGPHRAHHANQQYPVSPAAFSAPSPPRGSYGSPGPRGGGGAGGGGGGAFSARSPLYAASPAPYQQPSPAPAPAPAPARYSHSPQFARSPAPQTHHQPQNTMPCLTERNVPHPYSHSPAPSGGTTPFPAASPAGGGALQSYTPSPQHTPYSQHSSPAPRTPVYAEPYARLHELSADIGAAISAAGDPASPGLAQVDFEPPGRDATPPPDMDMHTRSNSNSSLGDYNKANSAVSEMSPAGSSFPPLYEERGGAGGAGAGGAPAQPFHLHSPHHIDKDVYHYQEQGSAVSEDPRLEQLHQHPSMYSSNYNRSTPEGGGGGAEASFRPPEQPHTPHHHPGSPVEFSGAVKVKPQDVASKSLSGLESLVDQIPSIAEGPAGAPAAGGPAPEPAPPPPALPEYAPALYPPYSYTQAAYGNNGYGAPFVGYGGGWVGSGVMRPTPGYLQTEWQYGGVYAPSSPGYPPYAAPYYTGYPPPPAHQHPHAHQTHYLSAPPLIDLHKNGEHAGGVPAVPSVPSVGFGGFC